ncbi:MAG: hypothetical protein FWE72_05880 [Spirochaetaceae bacterium]|nr:hypothetical protein [Spirochaetaceae bacterium]
MKRVGNLLISTCVKALAQSMNTDVMIVLARKVIPNYDLYGRLGFPRSMAIPNKDAARQIITDTIKNEYFIDFVLLMVEAGNSGVMGRRYSIPYMNDIISGVFELGYIYDRENNFFVEDSRYSITRNWGALKQGKEYGFAFMRLDIADNSIIVRENSEKDVRKAYDHLMQITTRSVLKRNGRIWSWDGDGGLASFFFGNKQQNAVMAGKEILHELFFYNYLDCPLKSPLKIRVAVHSGPYDYSPSEEELKACETVKKVVEIESHFTKPGTMTISQPVKVMLDNIARIGINLMKGKGSTECYNYEFKLEGK